MPTFAPQPDPDPGRCLICKVSLDHREGPLWEIARLREALEVIAGGDGCPQEIARQTLAGTERD